MKIDDIQVFSSKPNDFFPKVEIAAIYVRVESELLLLKLAPGKSEAGFWSVPAGKIEPCESAFKAAKRELFEETAITLPSEKSLHALGKLYIRKPQFDYVYHMFEVELDSRPNVQLSREHNEIQWVNSSDASKLNLMQGAKEALNFYTETTSGIGFRYISN